MFRIEIETGNAAFLPDAGPEVARLLRELADRLDGDDLPRYTPGASGGTRDLNGNTVLRWEWSE